MKTLKNFNVLLFFVLAGFVVSCQQGKKTEQAAEEETAMPAAEETMAPNTLTAQEKADGWMLLFDGQTHDNWRGYGKETFPSNWGVSDGTLHCQGSGRGEAGAENGGDILYEKKFSDFDLKIDWKISEGGNSGIFYLGQEDPKFEHIYETAPEYQVLDNERHPDAKLGKDGNRKAGSLYDLIPAKPQNAKPAGEWNTGEIIVYRGTVVHKMNGETVVEYHLWTPEWNEMVKNSKFPALNENFADIAKEGYIALQDHGDDVWYRNIKIKDMTY